MGRRQKVWEIREDLQPLLKEVKLLFPTLVGHVRRKRIFLCGFHNPRAEHTAKIRANRPPWALLTNDYDYLIQFWCTRFDQHDHDHKRYIVLHELMHIPEGGHDRENRHTFRRLIKHDIQDFRLLLRGYGISLQRISDIGKGERGLFFRKKKKRDR